MYKVGHGLKNTKMKRAVEWKLTVPAFSSSALDGHSRTQFRI